MNQKNLLRGVLAALLLVAVGVIGCSDDTQRVITNSEPSTVLESLATDLDPPTVGQDWGNFPDDEYYVPEFDEEELTGDFGTPTDHPVDDTPNTKPLDNGKN